MSHDFDNLLAKRRPDRELLDRLAEGRGVTGSKPCSNPHQFVKCYAALKPYMQKMKCPVSRLWQRQLNEMLWAGRAFFSGCANLSISADASRFSGLDRLLIAIAGANADGSMRAMWAPPMVPS